MRIHENLIQDNLANDDGGGLRMLQAGNHQIDVVNNIIANNTSAHEGGGIALDDSTNVRFVNNTVYRNITTATAVTSNGDPAPAGLSTADRTATSCRRPCLRARRPFSNPVMFNNVFWDNRAGCWNGQYISGINSPDAPAADPINRWDMGNVDSCDVAAQPHQHHAADRRPGRSASPTNKLASDPLVVDPFATTVTVQASRTFPSFRQALIVVQDVPPSLMGDYHLLQVRRHSAWRRPARR